MPHSLDALEDAAKHVAYEAAMLRAITDLIQVEHFKGDVLGQNLLTEGGLLHARVLDDFFRSPRRAKADDVIALDFTPTWRPASVFELTVDRSDVNKKLAHLTTQRREERSWRMAVYWLRAEELLTKLIGQLPTHQARWFTDPEVEVSDETRARKGNSIDAPLISAALRFRGQR